MWNPETDACDYCKECDYFLNEFWNCQGESEPCLEFLPKKGSKFNKVEITVTNNSDKNIRGKRAKFAVEDDWYIDPSIINEVLDGFVKKK